MKHSWLRLIGLIIVGTCSSAAPAVAADPVAGHVYRAPATDTVREQLLRWAHSRPAATDAQLTELRQMWDNPTAIPADALLDKVVRSFAVLDEEAAKLVSELQLDHPPLLAPLSQRWKEGQDPFYVANIGLYIGTQLVRLRMFDEGLETLKAVDAEQVVDPAGLFFYQAVAAQAVLELQPALDALEQLLEHTEGSPVRYTVTATLMRAELERLEQKSLGEIARLMADSERRLDLGRAGERVQGVQERILKTLDELIKSLEDNSQQDDSGSNQAQGGGAKPADDARVKGSTGKGESDPKQFSKDGRWGDLPEKEQAQAKNILNRDFPAHYRQAVDSYLKKLANRPAGARGTPPRTNE